MYENISIASIRILPSDKLTFKTETDFSTFINVTMPRRGGYYYFPNSKMNCPKNTLVLFQYDGMIRAIGILVDAEKKPMIDERGDAYAGYYKFDVSTLVYLDSPIDKIEFMKVYPLFSGFNQVKQIVSLEYLDGIIKLLQEKITSEDTDALKQIAIEIDSSIKDLKLLGKESEAIIKVRVNQGVFRERLLRRYNKCCLCKVSDTRLLTASHIKPWSKSESNEKLDVDNGFLFCPNHDKLFDYGLITFDDNGNIVISDELNLIDGLFLGVNYDMKISLNDNNKKYLKYHRDNVFEKWTK